MSSGSPPPLPPVPSAALPHLAAASLTGPAQDMGGQFAGMPGMPPPWQLNLWSAMAAGNLGAASGTGADYQANDSWEALFEFLGPDATAHAAATGQFDFPPLGLPGMGMPFGMPSGFPQGLPGGTPATNGAQAPNGAPAAAAV
jgi:hypothetical protein